MAASAERSGSDRRRWDVVIVGAGPAGCAVAIGLARRGWRALLVDHGQPGRPKCCGHCLHPRGVALLEVIGCADLVAGAARTTRGAAWWVSATGDRRLSARPFTDGGVLIDRRELDLGLARRAEDAGVEVRWGTKARLLGRCGEGARVSVDGVAHEVPLVVGADGLGSFVARAAGLAIRCVGRRFGFSLDLACTVDPDPSLRGAIGMFVERGAYLGVVMQPEGDRWTAHCGGCVTAAGPGRRSPGELLADLVARSEVLRTWLPSDWRQRPAELRACGPMPWRTRARTAEGVALVGDAAGAVGPFTGEGIAWALESAAALVASVGAPATWKAAERARYERAWRRCVGRGHGRAALLAALLDRPAALYTMAALDGRAPAAGRRLTELLVPR